MRLRSALFAVSMIIFTASASSCSGAGPAQGTGSNSDGSGAPLRSAATGFIEHSIPYEDHNIYAREWPGSGPAIVLMHGFPDDLHLYDQLVPELAPRRVIAFDFLGWGTSDKPAGRSYSADSQTRDVAAVLDYFSLEQAVLVVHDASGPPGIDWALDHPERVAKLVLLNTYYSLMPTLHAPEAITLYSTPDRSAIADTVAASPELNRDLYFWQVGGFIRNDALRTQLLPGFYERFVPALASFRSLNASLLADVAKRTARVDRLTRFGRPVQIVFGAADP